MKKLFLILISTLLFFSCEEILELFDYDFSDISKFTVEVGNHEYRIETSDGMKTPFSIQSSSVWSYYVLIDKNHKHEELIEGCNGDWNKIGGLTSEVLGSHMKNSGRWAFKYYDSTLYICPYTHDDDLVHKQGEINYGVYLTSTKDTVIANNFGLKIKFEKAYKLEIIDSSGYFIYKFENQLIAIHSHPISGEDFYRIQTPWFGGNCSFEGVMEDKSNVLRASIYWGKTSETTKERLENACEISKKSNNLIFKEYNKYFECSEIKNE